MEDKKNRVYILDWDDNIMYMPTKILAKKLVDGKWVSSEVSTTLWAEVRDTDEYQPIGTPPSFDEAFINFFVDGQFIIDLNLAIDTEKFGPSFAKFKEAIMYGHDFAIITARGHSPEALLEGVKLIVSRTFTEYELKHTKEALEGRDILEYLESQTYYGVTSKEFTKEFKSSITEETTTEIRKSVALKHYIKAKINSELEVDVLAKLSIGFSDDDKKNIDAAKELKVKLKEELRDEYPNVHFVIYDTSNPKKIDKQVIH